MDNNGSYSIAEAAETLNLSAKTIRRYIKAGKLPSVKVPTKFGDEYRITEIPASLRQEAEAQARAQAKGLPSDSSRPRVEVVQAPEEPEFKLDAHQLYQDNIRLALQLGAANARIRDLEDKLRLLQSPSPSFIASAVAEAASSAPPADASPASSSTHGAEPGPEGKHSTVTSSPPPQTQPASTAAEPPPAPAAQATEAARLGETGAAPRPWWKRILRLG